VEREDRYRIAPVADRIDREGGLAGHQTEERHIVLAGVLEEERRMIAMDGGLEEGQGVHRTHRAAAGMVSGREEDQEGRHSLAVVGKVAVVGMEAVLVEDTAGRSLAGDNRNS